MKDAKKITRLAGLAEMNQRDLAQSLSSAIRKQKKHRNQIDELKAYRTDYAAPLSHGELNSSNAQQIVAFMANLNSLIRTLEAQAADLATSVRSAEAAWIASQRQTKSYTKLARQALLSEQQTLDARQERNLDDAWLAQRPTRN